MYNNASRQKEAAETEHVVEIVVVEVDRVDSQKKTGYTESVLVESDHVIEVAMAVEVQAAVTVVVAGGGSENFSSGDTKQILVK